MQAGPAHVQQSALMSEGHLHYCLPMPQEKHENQLARWAKSGKEGSKPVPAATVIAVRDGDNGLETLMLRRNSKIAFGGMWVFPGGRVDPEDVQEGEDLSGPETARHAAAREAAEEAELDLSPADLIPFSHWTPPPITPKRFLTWFFIAAAQDSNVVIDGGEIHEHDWKSPAAALAQRDAGEIELAPPTWVSLFELARWKSVEEALAEVGARETERFETRIFVTDQGPSALWHGDAGWPEGDGERPGARHRLNMHKDGWIYERTS